MSKDLKNLIAKLNPICRKSLEEAAALCVAQTNYNVEIEHYLLKLIGIADSDLFRLLRYYEVNNSRINRELTAAMDQFKRGNQRTPAFSEHVLELLQEAWVISSLHFGGEDIRTGALLMALLQRESLRGLIVESSPSLLQIPRDRLREDIFELIKGSKEDDREDEKLSIEDETEIADEPPDLSMVEEIKGLPSESLDPKTPALNKFTSDLTHKAKIGEIDPIQGRDAEIRQVIDILTRRRQNNPILTGEPGVGKTAIAEGFALRIIKGDVPPALKNVSLRSLDLGSLQAGAGVRGEFEERLKSVIKEVKSSPKPVILFIDEAHSLIGAGASAGQGDAANLIKPALARGELRTIGATTWSEYKKYFEKDRALARRFQVVAVNEPEESVAINMLRAMAKHLEKHHKVWIFDQAVQDAVKLSHRYISGRQLPDKAVSVLDTACARVAIGQNGTPPSAENAARRIEILELEIAGLKRDNAAGQDRSTQIATLIDELESAKVEQEKVAVRWKKELKAVEKIKNLQERTFKLEKEYERNNSEEIQEKIRKTKRSALRLQRGLESFQGDEPMVPICVDSRVVASVISGWTGIPVGKMMADEIQTVLGLKNVMEKRIIGQSSAIDSICRRIRTSRAFLDDPGKPIGVFLLVGPSGVGKTESALALADILYGGEKNLIKINMSEYQEPYTVSNLKGAPPGYVGYGQGGVLTEAVRRAPYSVVLLDEVEKAHTDVTEVFYQVFDKGAMEDSEGLTVDFKNTVILLTCNIGTDVIIEACSNGREIVDVKELENKIRPLLLQHFKPAFLGRLVIVPYYTLGEIEISQIARLKLDKIKKRFKENHRADFVYGEDLISVIAQRCSEVDSGARNVDHILTHALLPQLSSAVLERMADEIEYSEVKVSLDSDENFVFNFI
jgi:type VI secretion system protein VasG